MRLWRRRRSLVVDEPLIRMLADLLQETGLSEIEYQDGDRRIRVAKDCVVGVCPTNIPRSVQRQDSPVGAEPQTGTMIRSPIGGVAYIASRPSAEPFVRVGSVVSAGQTVMIVEAMKHMNEIIAPRAGRVTKIYVEDGDDVQIDGPLLLIE